MTYFAVCSEGESGSEEEDGDENKENGENPGKRVGGQCYRAI